MELIRDSNQDRVDLVTDEHLVEVAISEAGLMQRRHAFAEVIGEIANGGQLDIASLLRGIKMGHLRDRSTAENAQAQLTGVLFHSESERVASL